MLIIVIAITGLLWQQEAVQEQVMNQIQIAVPAASAIAVRQGKLERENSQTARIFVGLMAVSFFTGIVTTILGFRRK